MTGTLRASVMASTRHLVMPEDHMERLYRSPNPLVRFVHNQRLAAIIKAVPRRSGLSVLDAGCGEGQLIERLQKALPDDHYVGVDITPVALEKARQRCQFATFKKADLSATGFGDSSFDVIVCTEVIEHVPEYNDVLAEFVRLLKPGGLLIITFPNKRL